ncbi:DUF4132 domain-containing protein [Actinomadura macra]|uniref:DUF4132 domain-containing protein n=1 Tax=Actinomadura macra TaxID=46164 RepID=UPI0008334B18|nr:DUF4132 domain-containing protein [Actinomadura macra]
MEDHLPALPAEDVLTIPEAWRKSLHARRGGAPGPEIKRAAAAPKAARKLVEATGGAVDSLLKGEAGDQALTEAARRYLDGADDAAGAAVIAAVTSLGTPRASAAVNRTFVDAWVAEHGIGFAACAVVERSRTQAIRRGGGDWVGTWVGAEHRKNDDGGGAAEETLRRVRGLLAVAAEHEYADAVERLAAHRLTWSMRWIVSYLAPTREDWVDECCAAPTPAPSGGGLRWLMYSALGTPAQLATPLMARGLFWKDATRALLVTMADGVGPGALDFFLANAGSGHLESADRRRLYETIALLPTDEAFQGLLDRIDRKHVRPALGEAMKRFPVRALRLLARAGADDLLAEHVMLHPEVVEAAQPGLPGDVRAEVERIAASSVRVPDAPEDVLPAVLTDPSWERARRPAVAGLQAPPPRLAWLDGEHREWLDADSGVGAPEGADWAMLVEGYTSGDHKTGSVQLMVHGPEELIRPLLPGFTGFARRDAHRWTRPLAARYGLDALPVAVRMAEAYPDTCADPLLPYLDEGVALLAADWLARRGKGADAGRRWLDRHGLDAVPLLVPAALATTAKRWRPAEHALRHLNGAHDLAGIVAATRTAHGDEAAAAIGELLAAHPAGTGLVQPPKIGEWLDPAVLPQVLLRGGDRALPREAARRLLELLAMSVPHGMEEIRRVCEPESVAEFGWALFQKWREAGKPSKDGWALTQLGRSGNDATVRLLTPVVRAWPGEGGHKHAVTGLGVLAEIGSDVALMHLHGIAQKVKFKGLQGEAQARIREVADRLGLSTEQLADRLVPDFGLDADGSMTLDYGPRRFRVGFDEQLKPTVADEDGKPRKSLPKPGAKDDPELAPAASKAFAALKKDVRTVASSQLMRLERAMVTQREWTAGEFREFVVGHPLVRHLARRLVWVASDGDTVSTFRIAEDGTFADVEDEAFTLTESAAVRVAHPLHLDVAAWGEVFADYEILQPFPQLGRAVHALTEKERDGERLDRFENLAVPFGRVAGLVRLGWERGEPQGGGNETWISRPVTGGRHLVIGLDPGLSAMELGANGDYQTLEHVWLADEPGEYRYRKDKKSTLRLGDLDAITASEVLAELTALTV